jgi:hypothetical protein
MIAWGKGLHKANPAYGEAALKTLELAHKADGRFYDAGSLASPATQAYNALKSHMSQKAK